MTNEKTKAMEICRSILSITATDLEPSIGENGIVVNDKLAADEISQLFLDADLGGGVITGPYLQPIDGTPKRIWYISTH